MFLTFFQITKCLKNMNSRKILCYHIIKNVLKAPSCSLMSELKNEDDENENKLQRI